MTPRTAPVLIACVLTSLVACAATAHGPQRGDSATDARGRRLLDEKLAALLGAERGQVVPLGDPTLAQMFPGHVWYVLRFRQFPVTLTPPDPLQANNLFVVKPDGSVGHVTDASSREGFFRSTLAPVTTQAEAKNATRAWLRLVEELHQDGFRQFSIPEQSLNVVRRVGGGQEAIGEALVTPHAGDSGRIVASLTFDDTGRLLSASETVTMKRGIRPICQATKLIDPDPIVRAMAEQQILVMGKAAKAYLDEQRSAAGPALRKAIDRLWRQIVAEDRE